MDAEEIMRQIRIFSELSGQIKYATQKRILIEMTLIKLCKPAMETSNEAVVARVKDLEEKIEKGVVQAAPAAVQSIKEAAKETPKPELPKAIPEDVKQIVSGWHSIVARTGQPLKTHLKIARLSLGGDNRLVIVVEDGLAYDYLSNEENHRHVEDMISNFIQKQVSVQVQSLSPGRRFEESYIDLAKVINMDIEIEDD